MSAEEIVHQVPASFETMVPVGATVLALAQIRIRGTKLEAVIEPSEGQRIPTRTPELLRWLADALEMRMLPEVERG